MYSYRDRNMYNASRCGWGELFGLDPKDLTEEQLKSIKADKLVELIFEDPRVEKIIAGKLKDCPLREIVRLKHISKDEIKKAPILFESYNGLVKYRNKEIEAMDKNHWSDSRGDYVMWDWLNDSNRAREFAKFIKRQKNIINVRKIDYSWLCNTYPWLANEVIKHILNRFVGRQHSNKSVRDPVPKMIVGLPEEFLVKNLDSIFSRCGNTTTSAFVLSNPNTPEKYIIKGLKAISGKIRVPDISMKISKKMLSKLPPVARLGVLETLIIHTQSKIVFEDITKSEDLELLLFGCAIKHTDRVKYVAHMFKLRYENRRY